MCNVGAAGSYRCVPDMSWFPLYDVIHVCTCTCPHTCIAVVSFTCNSWSSDPACDVIKKLQALSISVHVNFSMDDFDSAICCRYFNMHLNYISRRQKLRVPTCVTARRVKIPVLPCNQAVSCSTFPLWSLACSTLPHLRNAAVLSGESRIWTYK